MLQIYKNILKQTPGKITFRKNKPVISLTNIEFHAFDFSALVAQWRKYPPKLKKQPRDCH